ncbi:Fur family transcriptional regulator [Chloroflexota bacterium]
MNTTEKYRSTLESTGSRVTSQRALILDIVRKSDKHLDADEIYNIARRHHPRLSLSTVYRNLRTLKKHGLIEELDFNETHHHYEKKPTIEHHHLVCLNCGKISEFHYPIIRSIRTRVPEAKDFEIVDSNIRLTGYCANCKKLLIDTKIVSAPEGI